MTAHARQLLFTLMQLVAKRRLRISDVAVAESVEDDAMTVTGRSLDDPVLQPPASAEGQDGPWNHKCVTFSIVATTSDESGRPVLSATMDTVVEASHAHYRPLPDKDAREVRVSCNWQFDEETLAVGACELRDGDRLHYLSVLPPTWLVRTVKSVRDAERIVTRAT